MAEAQGLLGRVENRMQDFFAPESGMGVPNLPPEQAGLLQGGDVPNLGGLPQEAGAAAEAGPLPAPQPESTLDTLSAGQPEAPPELGAITLAELLTLGLDGFLQQLLYQPTDIGGGTEGGLGNAQGVGTPTESPSPQEGV